MAWLTEFIGKGAAVDAILALVVAEAALLIAYRFHTGSGLRAGTVVGLLLPGACLLLALRCALSNGTALSVAAFLLAAFVAHIADVTIRWRAAAG